MPPSSDVCSCCKDECVEKKQAPRQLKRLPTDVVQDGLFTKLGLPIRLCVYCDGDAYKEAIKAHNARTNK